MGILVIEISKADRQPLWEPYYAQITVKPLI